METKGYGSAAQEEKKDSPGDTGVNPSVLNDTLQGDAAHLECEATPPEEGPAIPHVIIDSTKDLWQNIILNTRDNQVTQTEVNALIVGTSGGGKTSILRRLFSGMNTASSSIPKSSLKVKPTTALDYSFARRNDRHIPQVAHFWELAQGTELSQLCDVVVTPENVHTILLAIVVDCSEPSTMWDTVAYWVKRVDRRVMEILQKMRAKGSTTPEKLLTRAKRLLGMDHPDMDRLRLSGIPTIIICNKLDAFAGDMTMLKTLVRCMRFIAHMYGCYLIFTSEADTTKLRAVMNHLIFVSNFDLKHIELDPERGAVLVIPSADTFADIGEPVVCDMGSFQSTGDTELDRWKASLDATFSAKQSETRTHNDSFLKRLYDTGENGFGEPTIDAVQKQKEDELEQYRKNAFKREKSNNEDRGKLKKKERE
ncbi:putative dynein light intermediate chain [Trypanosoma rangeli]|uniref:Cytoplasmic dynein 2 light intermediate chain 1 n=1 Tax=Trypanosoma rangeli TaxID=5698 RepID=A0A3R7P067_TRYRA|nr:putative dynein light intermediate chain [Trypanosoma rangeli]RNF10549.1 putative dynein light intermediate chain [Trypanosoma rangeli]|eukprot:RNF10549.1 putative dynein light intermediate chain [Trypanosoma rangeli]